MTEKFFHWLTGCARFEINGDHARFLNATAKSGFAMWGYERKSGMPIACCHAGDYKRLRPLARRCRVRLHCTEKSGMPFKLLRLRRRKGMLLGFACAVALYAFLGSFVWGVTVRGEDTITARQILLAAHNNGVYVGADKKSFTPRLAAHGIIADIPKLKWASVNTNGCFAEISVSERVETPNVTDDTKLSNIFAARAGTVCAIEAQHGRPEVKLGDTVAAGDLLISGLYRETPDPYSPVPEKPFQSLGAARGSIIAETYREFTVHVSAEKSEYIPTGEKKINTFVNIFGISIPLGINTQPKGNFRAYSKMKTVSALGTELPLSVTREIYEYTKQVSKTLSEEELKQSALLKLREAQRAELPAGGRVVKEELDYAFPDGMCILTARCRCEEEIGVLREILVNPTENE